MEEGAEEEEDDKDILNQLEKADNNENLEDLTYEQHMDDLMSHIEGIHEGKFQTSFHKDGNE